MNGFCINKEVYIYCYISVFVKKDILVEIADRIVMVIDTKDLAWKIAQIKHFL